MLSLPAILGISIGAAGFAAFSRKNKPWSTLKRICYFVAATIGILIVMLAVNFGLYYAELKS
ncbi:hypothetical protein [Agrobacterium bohemicum]|uniref:hypothetical protein n=1 Tax=Agrobacterium bohemicum TaxID=2052828 RepID=UPI000AB8D28B|nr:hypothetical protein [Agrobacterium bohemicum]